MVTAAKNSTSPSSPHHSALATRKSPAQTNPDRSDSTVRWNRARYYHAELGRFISRDPIGYVDGMNLYRAYFVPQGVDPRGLDILVLPVDDQDWSDSGESRECTDVEILFGLCPFPTRPPGQICHDEDLCFGPAGGRPGPPNNPGGPDELPKGDNRCHMNDTCAVLAQKISNYIFVIDSHRRWDIAHPDFRWPGGRHLQEIFELEQGLGRCWRIYGSKCRKKKNPRPCPRLDPCLDPDAVKDGVKVITAGVIIYWVISEGSRILCPPRNLIPIP